MALFNFTAVIRFEAYIQKGWRDAGLVMVFVLRRKEPGFVDLAGFLVDLWCLGVRDVLHDAEAPEASVNELIDERLPEEARETIHPSCARKLVEGAVAYAERLGFAPPRDFRKAKRVFSSLDAEVCPMEFSFGRDGRPCFVPGKDDSDERIDRVLAILDARVGEDGYDFEDPEDFLPDEIAEIREELMDWLDGEPEEVPRFFRVSGMIAAMILCPNPMTPLDVFHLVWPEKREWTDPDELREFTELLVNYWNFLADRMDELRTAKEFDPAGVADIWEDDLPEDDHGYAFLAAMVEWAGGFWESVEYWRAKWGDALTRDDLAAEWEVVRLWGNFLHAPNRDRLEAINAADPSRTFGAAITSIARRLESERRQEE